MCTHSAKYPGFAAFAARLGLAKSWSFLTLTGALAAWTTASAAVPTSPQGVITAKAYLNIGGTSIASLTGSPNYPDKPDLIVYEPYFEWNATGDISMPPSDFGDNYGVQMKGYFYPPVTGDYVFWIASDDNGNLYLSPTSDSAGKKLIAQEAGWSNARSWDVVGGTSTVEAKNSSTFTTTEWAVKDSVNGGARITLTKGQAYYIEVLMKEGTGGDHVAVAVQAPDGSIDSTLPIPGKYLSSDKNTGALTILTQPQSQTITENQPVTFRIDVDGTPPYTFQWQKNGSDIADATNFWVTLPSVPLKDNNAKITCKVTGTTSATTDAATLTVLADTVAPTVLKASTDETFASVVVKFSEPVSDTAIKASAYALDQGVTISAVTRVSADTISLTTSKLPPSSIYNLTVTGVQDMAATPNTLAANTKVEVRTLVYTTGQVVHKKYNNVTDATGNNISGLFDDPRFPGAPDRADLLNTFEYPANKVTRDGTADPVRNYFDTIEGFFIPPTTGNYVFFVTFADRCWLYLSTDENPANKYQLIGLQGWSDPRNWLTSHDYDVSLSRTDTATSNQWPDGATIHLTAGKKYYMLLVHHDPSWSGGDWFDATYKLDTEPDPVDGDAPKLTGNVLASYLDPTGASITFTAQPQSSTFQDAKEAKFSVVASGTSAYGSSLSYQWQSAPKGGTTFTDIAGATGSSYVIASVSSADDGKQFRVVTTLPGYSQTSSVATLTVVPDTFPPQVLGATAFAGGTKIGLMFDEPLDAASAALAANYQVNGAPITSAVVRTNVSNEKTSEKNLVQLTVPTAVNAGYTVTMSGVKDVKGNAMASTTVSGQIVKLTSTDIGSPAGQPGGPDPSFPSTVTTWGPGAFDVLSSGNDFWNNADGFNFLWEAKTNSFDVKVRVVSISPIDNWSAAAIEVREGPVTPNGGGWELARHYFSKVDYGGEDTTVLDNSGKGANSYEFNGRLAKGDPSLRETANTAPGGSVGWNGTGPGNPGAPTYPNAWMRIKREKAGTNDHLIAYTSSDGVSWSERMNVNLNDANHAGFLGVDGKPAGAWPDVCYVGLGSTSHTGVGNGNDTNDGSIGSYWFSPVGKSYAAYIIYRDYGDYTEPAPPGNLTCIANADGSMTMTYSGALYSSDTVNGTFTVVPGATSPFKVFPKTAGKTATFYLAK